MGKWGIEVGLCILAQGFEEIEALAVVDILRRAELEVKTVGVTGEIVGGSHGIVVACDTVEGVIDPSAAELIVLPGGIPGTLNLEKSAVVKEAIRSAMEDNRYIGAICAAPSILGHMGYLDDREITCYPGFESQMPKAYYTGEKGCRLGQYYHGERCWRRSGFRIEAGGSYGVASARQSVERVAAMLKKDIRAQKNELRAKNEVLSPRHAASSEKKKRMRQSVGAFNPLVNIKSVRPCFDVCIHRDRGGYAGFD